MNGTTSLAFSRVWQEAILGHMLDNYSFFLKCKSYLMPEWFVDPNIATIVKCAFEIHDSLTLSRKVLPYEIQGEFFKRHPDKNSQAAHIALMKRSTVSAGNVGLDILQRDMTTWIRLLKFREAMIEAESLYNKGDYEKSRMWLQSKLQEIGQTTFMEDDAVEFTDPDKYVEEMNEQFDNCLTLGCPDFDSLLIRTAADVPEKLKDPKRLETLTKGSLVPGDSTMLMGASNSGKTSAVITILCANIKIGKSVLYITHEQKPGDIRWRVLECFTDLTSEEISFMKKNPNPEPRDKLLAAGKILSQQLKYIPHTRPDDMWVESVIARIRGLQEEHIAKYGKGYDLLVVDYPGKLRSQKYTSKRTAVWEEQLFVYDQFVNLARHYNIHALLPVQTNREGFKINRGDGDRMVDQDDVGGSYGVMQVADNVITINRSNEDITNNTIMFHIAKCRSAGERLATYVSKTKLQCCRTHGVGLEGIKHPPEGKVSRDYIRQSLLHKLNENKAAEQMVPEPMSTTPSVPVIQQIEAAGEPTLDFFRQVTQSD